MTASLESQETGPAASAYGGDDIKECHSLCHRFPGRLHLAKQFSVLGGLMGSMKPLADHCLLGKLGRGVSVDWKMGGNQP